MFEKTHKIVGGRILIATMKADGAYAALVSGGFTAFTHKVAETLDLMNITPTHSWWMGIN